MLLRKKISACFLLAVLLVPAGMPLLLQWQCLHARLVAEERLERSMLVRLRLQRRDLQWAEEGRELLIGGRRFDVRSVSGEETVTVTGLFDDQETAIRSQIAASGKQQDKGLTQLGKHFSSFVCKLQENIPVAQDAAPDMRAAYNVHKDDALPEVWLRVPSPPPLEG